MCPADHWIPPGTSDEGPVESPATFHRALNAAVMLDDWSMLHCYG